MAVTLPCLAQSAAPRKRLLLVGGRGVVNHPRIRQLRTRGYSVDFAASTRTACGLCRSREYVLALIDLPSNRSDAFCCKLRCLCPGLLVGYIADPDRPIPPVRSQNFLWSQEGPEYFVARVETLANAA